MIKNGQPIAHGDVGEQIHLKMGEGTVTAPLAIDRQSTALVLAQPEIDRAIWKNLNIRGGLPVSGQDPRDAGDAHQYERKGTHIAPSAKYTREQGQRKAPHAFTGGLGEHDRSFRQQHGGEGLSPTGVCEGGDRTDVQAHSYISSGGNIGRFSAAGDIAVI